ncbi:MAG: DUF4032 domain-containing protein [Spirochaetaceae bacterium]|jgi:hypothetical protein|nr:DUF4032 domain-containing protein [Spirochaetaceae bacterium]
MIEMQKSQAEDDFSRARTRAIISRFRHFLDHRKDDLLSFADIKDILRPKSESYRGMQTVPLNLIVGSEGRYRDFTKYFLPRAEHLRDRWVRVDEARLKDIVLPPIKLYEVGGVYFVRDGNHRVSVARSQGGEMIDAEITSLSSEIPLSPSMTTEELRERVIHYEKQLFYEKTRFGEITGDQNLDFGQPGQYDIIYHHILEHKYYINQGRKGEISLDAAIRSWYRNVYEPAAGIIRAEKLCARFPRRTEGDLYLWLVAYWDLLKKKYGVYSLADAARDFSRRYGTSKSGILSLLAALAGKLFRAKRPARFNED